MGKFIAGFLAGVFMTLYIISSLGSDLSDPLKKPATLMKETRDETRAGNKSEISKEPGTETKGNNIYQEKITFIKRYDTEKASPDDSAITLPPETGKDTKQLIMAATQIIEKVETLPYYKMSLMGPAGKKEGKVLISSDNSVWCDLQTLSAAMGWKLTSDGGVYSTMAGHNLLFKIDAQKLMSDNDAIFISLSYLKNMWLLDFSVNPASHILELS